MEIDYSQLSRTVSHALRHEPWLYELELDEEGWVSVDELLLALRTENKLWEKLSVAELNQMVNASTKKRHEIDGNKVRALYGHSIPGKLLKKNAQPPDILYHGTSKKVAAVILEEGLKPMCRQYVHLSVDVSMAKQVALRKSKDIVVLKIDAKKAFASGVKFYIGNDHVWLADELPEIYIMS